MLRSSAFPPQHSLVHSHTDTTTSCRFGGCPLTPTSTTGKRGLVSVRQREPVLPLSFLSENICK